MGCWILAGVGEPQPTLPGVTMCIVSGWVATDSTPGTVSCSASAAPPPAPRQSSLDRGLGGDENGAGVVDGGGSGAEVTPVIILGPRHTHPAPGEPVMGGATFT